MQRSYMFGFLYTHTQKSDTIPLHMHQPRRAWFLCGDSLKIIFGTVYRGWFCNQISDVIPAPYSFKNRIRPVIIGFLKVKIYFLEFDLFTLLCCQKGVEFREKTVFILYFRDFFCETQKLLRRTKHTFLCICRCKLIICLFLVQYYCTLLSTTFRKFY